MNSKFKSAVLSANVILTGWLIWYFAKKAEPANPGLVRRIVFTLACLFVTWLILNAEYLLFQFSKSILNRRRWKKVEKVYGYRRSFCQDPPADGLLTVNKDGKMFHVRFKDATPLYPQKYKYVDKFYEGLAVVSDGDENWLPTSAHHIKPDGQPAYNQRFPKVSKFHEGLAIVTERVADDVYHPLRHFFITPDGQRAYPEVYHRANEFREGLAMVDNGEWNGAFHIRRDGSRAYEHSYFSAGDFSEGLAFVREKSRDNSHDVMYHIRPDGTPAYPQRFYQVGSFKDGTTRAWQTEGNQSFLIRPDGTRI